MFGMGGTEILVILVVAMLFLGPDKLPEAAAKISKGIRDIRKQQRELTQTIENDTEIGGAIRELKSALRGDEVRRPHVRKQPPVEAGDATAGTAAAAAIAAGDAPVADETVPVAAAAAAAESETVVAAAAAETEAAVDGEAEVEADDPDDPRKLIRPASGTAKREHG